MDYNKSKLVIFICFFSLGFSQLVFSSEPQDFEGTWISGEIGNDTTQYLSIDWIEENVFYTTFLDLLNNSFYSGYSYIDSEGFLRLDNSNDNISFISVKLDDMNDYEFKSRVKLFMYCWGENRSYDPDYEFNKIDNLYLYGSSISNNISLDDFKQFIDSQD